MKTLCGVVVVGLGFLLLPSLGLGQRLEMPDDGSGLVLLHYCLAAIDDAEGKPLMPQAKHHATYWDLRH